MTQIVSNLSRNLTLPEQFSNSQKQYLSKLARGATGVRAVLTAVSATNTSFTVPSDSLLRVNGLRPGKRYLVRAFLRGANGTVANGFLAGLRLTGTGNASATCLLTSTGFGNAAASAAAPFAFATNILSGAAVLNATNGTHTTLEGTILPLAEGDLIVTLREFTTGGGAATLRPDSFLEVQELVF